MKNSKVTVRVIKGDINKALKRFKSMAFSVGHLDEYKDRRTYTKPKTVRRKQKLDAIRAEKRSVQQQNE